MEKYRIIIVVLAVALAVGMTVFLNFLIAENLILLSQQSQPTKTQSSTWG